MKEPSLAGLTIAELTELLFGCAALYSMRDVPRPHAAHRTSFEISDVRVLVHHSILA